MVRLNGRLDMTIAVDWDVKQQTKQKQIHGPQNREKELENVSYIVCSLVWLQNASYLLKCHLNPRNLWTFALIKGSFVVILVNNHDKKFCMLVCHLLIFFKTNI